MGLTLWVSVARVMKNSEVSTLGVIYKLRELWGTIEYRKVWM